MEIIELSGRLKRPAVINEVEEEDFRGLTKKRYSFNWKPLKEVAAVYKLQIAGEDDILGVMGLTDTPEEKRIQIKLLACSVEDQGKNKIYEGIAGCLIAYACRIAKIKYGYLACVSLVPKTALKTHYINKYDMVDAGWQLYLEGEQLNNIIVKYL